MRKTVDLSQLATELVAEYPTIASLWLFGSRRHRTRSLRSDIDVLVVSTAFIKPGDARRSTQKLCPALDLFLTDGGRAVSCMNESFVEAESFEALRSKLDAICIWSRVAGEVATDAPLQQEFRSDVAYLPSGLDGGYPRIGQWGSAVEDYFKEVEAARLPLKPFIGDTPLAIANFLVDLTAAVVSTSEHMAARKTRASWKPALKSEYDSQDAFYLAVKPWLPDLAREETLLLFDGQEKRADFSLLGARVAIEMKHASDGNTKASIVKTLDGLARFYTMNPRVEVLLFLITASKAADVDAARWAREFSSSSLAQTILTRVFVVG